MITAAGPCQSEACSQDARSMSFMRLSEGAEMIRDERLG